MACNVEEGGKLQHVKESTRGRLRLNESQPFFFIFRKDGGNKG